MNHFSVRRCSILTAATLLLLPAYGQEVLLKEDFNSDGATANPPRYSITGGFRSEPPHNADEVSGPADQTGPVYWARNTEVSFAGVPAPTKGRRALLVWDGLLTANEASADLLKLVANTVKWLAKDKANAQLIFSPNAAAAQGLADYLTSLGYTITDDDANVAETALTADALIKAPGAGPSRFANSPQGVLTFSSADHDDMLVSSIGVTAAFESTRANISASTHPIAAGVAASFVPATGSFTWNLMGDVLPGGATTIATMERSISPTAASLADVEGMAAGTKSAIKASGTLTELDLADGSAGDWTSDNPLPGGATGVWGVVAKGKLNVKKAGKFSFALAMDDGARLRIDKNKNGFGADDNVVLEDAGGAHRARYGDVTFDAAGAYDFEVVGFNSGGSGDLEMSVSVTDGGGDVSAINSGTWELLGATTGNVELSGTITVDSYVPSGADQVVTLPLLVVLNGPTDSPAGSVFGGGPFEGFEGTGFFGGAGLNKWLPDPINNYRAVRLKPVDVTGKANVRLTAALAATFLDFETSDFLDLVVYPNGENSPEVQLARFSAPDGNSKYFVDITHGNSNRLGLRFQDVSYAVPAGATQLIVEVRAATTWWNEIVAFDNLRVTAGSASASPATLTSSKVVAGKLELTWTGGQPPFTVQSAPVLGGAWTTVTTGNERTASVPITGTAGFFRIAN